MDNSDNNTNVISSDTSSANNHTGKNKRFRKLTVIELSVIIIFTGIFAAVIYPIYKHASDNKKQQTCMGNQKVIACSMLMFAQDHETFLPYTNSWFAAICIWGSDLDCPATKIIASGNLSEYGYNQYLNNEKLTAIPLPAATLLTADYTSAPDAELYGIKHSYQISKRHNNKAVISYVDGHVAVGEIYQLKNITNNK